MARSAAGVLASGPVGSQVARFFEGQEARGAGWRTHEGGGEALAAQGAKVARKVAVARQDGDQGRPRERPLAPRKASDGVLERRVDGAGLGADAHVGDACVEQGLDRGVGRVVADSLGLVLGEEHQPIHDARRTTEAAHGCDALDSPLHQQPGVEVTRIGKVAVLAVVEDDQPSRGAAASAAVGKEEQRPEKRQREKREQRRREEGDVCGRHLQ